MGQKQNGLQLFFPLLGLAACFASGGCGMPAGDTPSAPVCHKGGAGGGSSFTAAPPVMSSPGLHGFDNFGGAIAVSGDTAVIGSSYMEVEGAIEVGKAFVYVRSGNSWSPQAELIGSDGDEFDMFGGSAAIDGDTLVIGAAHSPGLVSAPGGRVNTKGFGKAYVYARSGTSWSMQAEILPEDALAADGFGSSVALSGDTLLIGAPGPNRLAGPSATIGAAYVYARTGTSWSLQARLQPSDGVASDRFGSRVALGQDTAIVSAPNKDDKGQAYVFVRSGSSWSEQARLLASDGTAGDRFGANLALNADTAVVSAPDKNEFHGQAYVFVRSGSSWSQQAVLLSPERVEINIFGSSMALRGDTLVIADPLVGIPATAARSQVLSYTRCGSSWSQPGQLLASDGEVADMFGAAVALSGDSVLIGAARSEPGQVYMCTPEQWQRCP